MTAGSQPSTVKCSMDWSRLSLSSLPWPSTGQREAPSGPLMEREAYQAPPLPPKEQPSTVT